MYNSFGIFSEDLESDKQKIYDISAGCRKLNDVVLFTNSINTKGLNNYAIFPSFYMKFFKGIVIFLNIEDHILYKDSIIGKPMLYLTEEMLKNNNIDLSLLNKNNIFQNSENTNEI